jgi:hypothetical protein
MQDEGHEEFLDKAPPHAWTFAFNTVVDVPSEFILQEGTILLRDEGLIGLEPLSTSSRVKVSPEVVSCWRSSDKADPTWDMCQLVSG